MTKIVSDVIDPDPPIDSTDDDVRTIITSYFDSNGMNNAKLGAANILDILKQAGFVLTVRDARAWRCFHCDSVFANPNLAAEHFGADPTAAPACKIAAHERHLVTYIRRLEDDLARYRAEDSDVMRSIMVLEADHRQALVNAEEAGYEKGLRDGRVVDA